MSADPAGSGPVHYKDPLTATPRAADAPRRALVRFFIFATAAIFVALFAILYFRWAGAQEPSSAIMLVTTPPFVGTDLIVEGLALPQPYRVTVTPRTNRNVTFYLDRGSYTLRIASGERTIYSGDFSLRQNELLRLDLRQFEHLLPPSTTAPSGASASARTLN